VRRTNKYFILQAVESDEAQDKVLATITSKELLSPRDDSGEPNNGWDAKAGGSLKSIPAGYLTGLLFAKKLGGKGKYIMDLGMARTLKGGRVFSVVKGLIDGGLDIPANEKVFPSEERLNGEHLKDDVKAMIAKVKGVLK
jgi:large subunit ribosomal protein L18